MIPSQSHFLLPSPPLESDTWLCWSPGPWTPIQGFAHRPHRGHVVPRPLAPNPSLLGDTDWDLPQDVDPFYENTDDEVLIGQCQVYLKCLTYRIGFEESIIITDYQAKEKGFLQVWFSHNIELRHRNDSRSINLVLRSQQCLYHLYCSGRDAPSY